MQNVILSSETIAAMSAPELAAIVDLLDRPVRHALAVVNNPTCELEDLGVSLAEARIRLRNVSALSAVEAALCDAQVAA